MWRRLETHGSPRAGLSPAHSKPLYKYSVIVMEHVFAITMMWTKGLGSVLVYKPRGPGQINQDPHVQAKSINKILRPT